MIEGVILKLLNKIQKGWQAEVKFHPVRKWRFDFAHPELKIAVEIEGGLWVIGRHNRPQSMIKDIEKYNQAILLGWRVLRYTPQQTGELIRDVEILIYHLRRDLSQ
ncbi:MAG: hypothetical protein KGQ83_09870 [Planctomycetes bacterium]|nr:hypothetical protein [Planctomycetota bacterium]MDE2144891.1 hypothetical protein [Patescibacteria group bacterium]